MEEQQYTYDVFISYSHKDGEWVRNTLLPRLEAVGLSVYIDYRDFVPGLPSLVNMENAVEHSRKTLIVLTPDWVKSEWTVFESLLIQTDDPAGRRVRMIPLLLEPCKLPRRIAILTYVDFTRPDDLSLAWERLLNALGAKLREPTEARIESLQIQLRTRKRKLARLQERRASYSELDVSIAIINAIAEEQKEIEWLEKELATTVGRSTITGTLSNVMEAMIRSPNVVFILIWLSILLAWSLIGRGIIEPSVFLLAMASLLVIGSAGVILSRLLRRPDREPLLQESESLRRQLEQHRRNLRVLLEQRAMYPSGESPVHLFNQIAAEESEVTRLKNELSELEARLSASPAKEALTEFLRSTVWQSIGAIAAVLTLVASLLQILGPSVLERILPVSLPTYAVSIGLLVLTTLTVLGVYTSRVVLPRRMQARINRERERDWQQWEKEVEGLLFDRGIVAPQDMVETPREHRTFAIEKYFRDHRNQLAIRLRGRDNALELENRHLTSRFTRSWDKASAYLASLDKNSFLEACSDILGCLHDLGVHRCERPSVTFGRLHGFVVEVPSLSLNIPQHFPIVFVQKDRFLAEDVEDVIDLKKHMGKEGAYFVVLVVFVRAADVEEEIKMESSVYGIDFCVLDRKHLWNLLISRTGEKDLINMLIGKASLLRICPYLIYGPAPDSVFFGREREISQALTSVKKASIAIVGGRKIGKTSTLNKIERALSKRVDVHSVYLDCYKIRDYEAFFDKLDTNLEELELLKATRDPLRFDSVVSSIQRKIGSKRLVFLMDEVDALLDYDTQHNEDLFGTFRSVSQEGKCSFVLCGAKVLYFSLHNPDSALFNFCDTLRLGNFDAENSAKLITVPMSRIGVRIENEQVLVDKIIATTSGHPNLIQFICRRMVERIDRERRRNITLDDFLVVSESADFREFFVEVVWGDTTPLERLVMLSLVEGKELTESDIIVGLHNQGVPVDLKQLQQAIRGLWLYSIIIDMGNRYTFVAKAFPDIVKYSRNIDLLRRQYKKEWKEPRE